MMNKNKDQCSAWGCIAANPADEASQQWRIVIEQVEKVVDVV